jgi:hypothetical protein
VHYGSGDELAWPEHGLYIVVSAFAVLFNSVGEPRQTYNDYPLRLLLNGLWQGRFMPLLLLEFGDEVNEFVPKVVLINFSIRTALPEGSGP